MNDTPGGLNPVHLYSYLAKARERLFDWIRPLTLEQYTQEFPFGVKTLRDTLVEIPQAEWTYVQRLRGAADIPPWEERPFARFYKTDFAPLEPAIHAQVGETTKTLREITDWARTVEYSFVDEGERVSIRTTTGGIAAQLCFHEIHHRAQAMAMLRQLGAPAQDLDYSFLMYDIARRPA
ncbi:MAG TPA: DinB family protein [bacterium]